MGKFSFIPRVSRGIYSISVTQDRKYMFPELKPEQNLYCVAGVIEFFYAVEVSASKRFILLKVVPHTGDKDIYFVVNRTTMKTCNDIYVDSETSVYLDSDNDSVVISRSRGLMDPDDMYGWCGWANEATQEQIEQSVESVSPIDMEILVYQNIIRDSFYFLYKSDVRNRYLTVYDKDTKCLLAEIK